MRLPNLNQLAVGGCLRVNSRASPTQTLALDRDALGEVYSHAELKLALKLVSRATRDAAPDKTETSVSKVVGGVALLRWARANGCPWNERTCATAAAGGHLEVLQWAHDNECPWDERTCALAAMGGHLAVLQWARANGCPSYD